MCKKKNNNKLKKVKSRVSYRSGIPPFPFPDLANSTDDLLLAYTKPYQIAMLGKDMELLIVLFFSWMLILLDS